MSQPMRLRTAWATRDERFPADDDVFPERLHTMLVEKLGPRLPRPTAFLYHTESVQIVDAMPLVTAPNSHRWLSALAGQEGVLAMGMIAVLHKRKGERVFERCAGTFVEWSDGRWWWSRRILDAQNLPRPDLDDEPLRAVDGATKPMGLGGWFARARFEQLRLRTQGTGPEQWN